MKVYNKSPNSIPILIGFSLLFIGVAQIAALWALTKAIMPSVIESSSLLEVQPAHLSPQLYQLSIGENRIRLAPKTIHTTAASPKIALKQALNQLLTQSAFSKSITVPAQTRLLDLRVTKNGVSVDLSQEFTQDVGSSSMIYRVAQVLYTATSLDSQAPVFLSIEGTPLDSNYPLGREGLLLKYPLTRQQFHQDFLTE